MISFVIIILWRRIKEMKAWTIEELAASVIEGNMSAFEELYKRTSKQVYYTCMSFLKKETNVYDAMQDTYLTALTNLNQRKIYYGAGHMRVCRLIC
jgi:hypothetical protein